MLARLAGWPRKSKRFPTSHATPQEATSTCSRLTGVVNGECNERERERERVVNNGNSESSDRDHSSVKETQAKAIDPERKRTRAFLPSRPA
jgi:hypothetical protein